MNKSTLSEGLEMVYRGCHGKGGNAKHKNLLMSVCLCVFVWKREREWYNLQCKVVPNHMGLTHITYQNQMQPNHYQLFWVWKFDNMHNDMYHDGFTLFFFLLMVCMYFSSLRNVCALRCQSTGLPMPIHHSIQRIFIFQ